MTYGKSQKRVLALIGSQQQKSEANNSSIVQIKFNFNFLEDIQAMALFQIFAEEVVFGLSRLSRKDNVLQ